MQSPNSSALPSLCLLLLTLVLLDSSCSFSARPVYIDVEKKTAERAVEQFHSRMNAEQYDAIYDDAHEVFKSSNDKQAVIPMMKATRERSGKIIQVTAHWINYVKGDPIPVRAIYNVKCENGEFCEWFAYSMSQDGSKALLAQYQNFPGYCTPPN